MADRQGWNVTDRIAVGCVCIVLGGAGGLAGWPVVVVAVAGVGIGLVGTGVIDAIGGDR